METKFFLHRIQRKNGTIEKGIEVHETLNAAILAYHGRMKLAGSQDPGGIDFVSCMVTDGSGAVVRPYAETWLRGGYEVAFFVHYTRKDGNSYIKGIDVYADYESAKQDHSSSCASMVADAFYHISFIARQQFP